jgi:AhpD family alkylhydroperoxidase
MRASEINGCAYCLDVHSKDARALGETEQRLYVLGAWEEAPFTPSANARRTRLLTPSPKSRKVMCPDAVFERARAHFNEQELIALVFTLTTINAWNRHAITMRTEVGKYQPKASIAIEIRRIIVVLQSAREFLESSFNNSLLHVSEVLTNCEREFSL